MTQLEWERYFFRRLAGTYFTCRFQAMGHDVEVLPPITSRHQFEGVLQGMQDYGWAMRDAIRRRSEVLKNGDRAGGEGVFP
jgi:hypothetical protein